jgi:hypothetical protein
MEHLRGEPYTGDDEDEEPRMPAPPFHCMYCGTHLRWLEVENKKQEETRTVLGCPSCWCDLDFVGDYIFGKVRIAQ